MKAQNKFQKEIIGYKLRNITPKQEQWAKSRIMPRYFVISRKTTFCLECGHKWKENILNLQIEKRCVCPNCQAKLKLCHDHTIDRVSRYFAIITTHRGYQVVRMCIINKYFKKKHACSHYIKEVMQHWVRNDGRIETLSLATQGMSMYYDAWVYNSELEPRTRSYKHEMRCNLQPEKIYPSRSILPIIKRNGFIGYTYDLVPHRLFATLLRDNKAETLFKAGQIDLVRNFFRMETNIKKFWSSIRICMRNRYIIKDAGVYFDYLYFLDYFGKDLHSPKYLCPENLLEEHDRLSRKKARIEAYQQKLKYQREYEEHKAKFLNLLFTDGNLVVKPLQTIFEFKEEADAHGHCVYSRDYFLKEESLVLSAKVDGKHTETVEFSLDNLEILQSRGRGNKATRYNQRIRKLVQDNIHQITKAKSA